MSNPTDPNTPLFKLRGIRYQVRNLERSIAFYTQHLNFKLDFSVPPAFAQVSIDTLHLLLSGPGSSGARPLPDGRAQEPGGFNRIVLRVADLPARIQQLQAAGIPFRGTLQSGPGGSQIQIEDPDGNPIELFEPGPRH